MRYFLAIFLAVAIAIVASGVRSSEPVDVEPSFLPVVLRAENTPTPTATATPSPTSTPTPTNTPVPTAVATATSTPTATAVPVAVVVIEAIDHSPSPTLNEWVRIRNNGTGAADMTGWTLRDEANHVFTFPAFVLAPGGTVMVWTPAGVDNGGNLYWGSGTPIWNNGGDCAFLRNAADGLVHEFCY